jgi:hypothetical protein
MSHLVKCYKCQKCGHVNQQEPSNADCGAWFGCDFEKGKYEVIEVPVQKIRKDEKNKSDEEIFGGLWVIHAIIVGIVKSSFMKGVGALFIGPFMWFF